MTHEPSLPTAIMWCTHHKIDTPMVGIPGLTAIYAGVSADAMQGKAVCDILSDGSRLRNDYYSELSAIYKIWKEGPRSDIVGWCHYRRYFYFGARTLPSGGWLTDFRSSVVSNIQDFVPHNLSNLCTDRSFVVVNSYELGKSIYENYKECHNIDDYLDYFRIVLKTNPELAPYLGNQFTRHVIHPCNMFISTWAVFDEVCTLWFNTLEKFVNNRPQLHEDPYQNRVPSFLSERVFDAWVQFKKDQGFQVHELPVIMLRD